MAVLENEYFKKISSTFILFILLVLAFLVLKPILLSIIIGIILAIVISPAHDWLTQKTQSRNLSITIICIFLILLIVVPFWFLTPLFVKQTLNVYESAQKVDFTNFFKKVFPSIFASENISTEFGSVFGSFVTKTLNGLTGGFSELIINFPTIFLHLIVVFATFFFMLRDKDEILTYIGSLMPFPKDVEKNLIRSSKDITFSVVYGQIVIGFVQGIMAGIGFFIFKVPNTIFLTLFAAVAGVLPIIGPALVWIPVVVYLIIAGNSTAAIGVSFFGLLSIILDNLLRPFFISRGARLHPLLSLIGMIGGLFLFGVLGFILGPLILAYVIIILEIYRGKQLQGFLIKQE